LAVDLDAECTLTSRYRDPYLGANSLHIPFNCIARIAEGVDRETALISMQSKVHRWVFDAHPAVKAGVGDRKGRALRA
jgi:hypothetical protein